MTRPKALILEDDWQTLQRHGAELEGRGVKCFLTQLASEAISLMRADKSIRFVVVDVILREIEDNSIKLQRHELETSLIDEADLQENTGDGVVREINTYREDVRYVFITSAPLLRSKDSAKALMKEERILHTHKGVMDVIHRYQIDDSSSQAAQVYDRIFAYIRDVYSTPYTSVKREIAIAQCSQSIGRIQVIPRFYQPPNSTVAAEYGTGWLVTPGIVLTCWHLFDKFISVKESSEGTRLDLQSTLTSSEITFDYLSNGSGVSYRFREIISHSCEFDYTLIRLCDSADSPLSQRTPLLLERENPIQDDPDLAVIHHPQSIEQQVSKGWHVQLLDNLARILYALETRGGTSGSPVIRLDTSRAIAMHIAFNDGYNLSEGLLVSKILEDLHDHNPHICSEIINYHQES